MQKIAVGQITSGWPEQEPLKRNASFRIRVLSSVGLYPQGAIREPRGIYHVDEQIAFIAVRTDEQRKHVYWSELTLFALEEIRFLSAILLSMRPDHGVLRLYPGGAHLTDSDPKNFLEKAKELASSAENKRRKDSTLLTGSPQYQVSNQQVDTERYKKLISKISIRDHLMLRGLSALLKADMLQVHQEFQEEANTILYIAMDAALQLTLRRLKETGKKNPSALDAGNFLHSEFPNETPGKRFFEDYYKDRIKTLHPHNRAGAFAFPPLSASHSYGLRAGLIAVFQYLITKERWYTLWD
jgi:hypothetical protein